MLHSLLTPLYSHFSVMNVFRYITVRTALATLTALLISLILGPWVIRMLDRFQIAQSVREEGPKSHAKKQGTPTMGGVLILVAVLVPTLLWMDLRNRFVWLLLVSTVLFGLIGFLDDYRKVAGKRNLGLTARKKIALQALAAALVASILYSWSFGGKQAAFSSELHVPFFKSFSPDLSYWFLPFAILVIVSSSNAVNLTDGLDGLAVGAVLVCSATYTVLSYTSGHAVAARYLGIFHVPHIGEITIFGGAMVGASLGFLWFNCYPAQVFMGDVGSLALGAAIGTVAVRIKQERVLLIVGGLFVAEALSVFLLVAVVNLTGGTRLCRRPPIHHHVERPGSPPRSPRRRGRTSGT